MRLRGAWAGASFGHDVGRPLGPGLGPVAARALWRAQDFKMRTLRGLNKPSWRCGPVLPFACWPWAGPPRDGPLGSRRWAVVVRTHVWGLCGVDFTWTGAALPALGSRGRLATPDWTPAPEGGLGGGGDTPGP